MNRILSAAILCWSVIFTLASIAAQAHSWGVAPTAAAIDVREALRTESASAAYRRYASAWREGTTAAEVMSMLATSSPLRQLRQVDGPGDAIAKLRPFFVGMTSVVVGPEAGDGDRRWFEVFVTMADGEGMYGSVTMVREQNSWKLEWEVYRPHRAPTTHHSPSSPATLDDEGMAECVQGRS
jgi:hypothetical protein